MTSLMYMTKINIPYLSSLDYVDLLNLCKTNKSFANLCHDDQLLRDIIYHRNPNITITPHFQIANVLHNLYNQFYRIIDDNYADLPRWVNRHQFRDDMVRRLSLLFVDELTNKVTRNNNPHFIFLNKQAIAIPFESSKSDIDLDDTDTDEIYNIIALNNINKYIKPSIIKYDVNNHLYYWKMYNILKDLLLIN